MNITKEELIKYLVETKNIKQEKVDEIWKEKENEAKSLGLTNPEDIELRTKRMVSLYFRKMTSQKEIEPIQIIPLGLTPRTDYGAKNNYDKAIILYEKDKNRAILEGYTTEAGLPIWRGSKLSAKNGRPIEPEKETTRQIIGLARRPEDTTWKIGLLSLSGEALKYNVELGRLYDTNALIGRATQEVWHNERIIMYSGAGTELKNPKKPEESLKKMIENYTSELIKPFSDIDIRARQDKAISDYFYVKANVVSTRETKSGVNNIIVFSDPDDLLFNEEKQLTGWVDEDIPLNIVDEAMDVYLLINARTYMRKDDNNVESEKLQISVYGYYVLPEFRKTKENTPVVGNLGQQTVPQREEDVFEVDVGDW